MRLWLYALALMIVGFAIFTASYDESRRQQYQLTSADSQDCIHLTEEELKHLKEIGHEALNEALKDHISKLFSTWMRDDAGQPGRANNGVRAGVKAYLSARKNLESWGSGVCF